ncbi:heavy metal translocating P-type ATPase [Undibacterium sp. TJN19]|uniref:heavy metal translocating P-type ATPase n=1 Tax=Undibacterium sp. TJN19 TaxID=3413055 RepID=UPI003BF22454
MDNALPVDKLNDTQLQVKQEHINLSGMRCAACVQLIEYRIRQLSGVLSFKVHPASHRAVVRWKAELISLKQILNAIIDLGYGALPSSMSVDAFEQKENKLALWRLFVAGFAMMQVMMYAFPAYLVPVPQIDGDLTPDVDRLLKIASMIITIPVIGFSAMPFFQSAWRDLKNRHIGMDVPVSLGILLTFMASVWSTFAGGVVYFDTAIMFVFLLLGARLIESKVQKRTSAALRILTQLTPSLAQRFLDFPRHRATEIVDASVLQPDDMLLVAAGEQVPVDGVVVAGESACDEALMTGESLPVTKCAGSNVIAGSVNIYGALTVKAQATGGQTQLSALIDMMDSAAAEKPALVLLADRHASRFLLFILLAAAVSAAVWWQIDATRAIWIAISIVVVTCPCALSLATPGVMSAAIGMLARNGVLLTKARALQAMAQTTHVVFDKTGTLTMGKLQVNEVIAMPSSVLGGMQAEMMAFALASRSTHPVARAIAYHLQSGVDVSDMPELSGVCEVPGAGIEATCNDRRYRLGSLAFVRELHAGCYPIPASVSEQTLAMLSNEDDDILLFGLNDALREDAIEVIQHLKRTGKKIVLLSGDRAEVVVKVAAQCDIQDARGGLSPADKHHLVQQLQAGGATVMMVGDGMNDGPVLALANVSVAMGQGAPISQTRSDILLMSNRLLDLDFALTVATSAYRLIKENLAWAVLYNLLAIPAAIAGIIEPWHAALGMSLSSLIVVLNALRLYLLPQPQHFTQAKT